MKSQSKKNVEEKKIGRPTDYHDDIPVLLIEAMRNGKSVTRFCAQIGIAKQTFYRWLSEKPNFSDAFELAKNFCESYWEEWMVNNFTTKDINSTLVKLFMANRFGWSDKQDVKGDLDMKLKVSEEATQIKEIRESYKKEF